MEKIKIENFEKENKNIKFPEFSSLPPDECISFLKMLTKKFGSEGVDGKGFVSYVNRNGNFIADFNFNAICDGFDFISMMIKIRLNISKKLFLNWNQYDCIDSLAADDFGNFFTDIWYPSVDNLDIFDESMQWIISIRHDGHIKLLSAQLK